MCNQVYLAPDQLLVTVGSTPGLDIIQYLEQSSIPEYRYAIITQTSENIHWGETFQIQSLFQQNCNPSHDQLVVSSRINTWLICHPGS